MEHDSPETTLSLVRAAQEGERDALERLFARYLPRVQQIVALRLGYPLRAFVSHEDLVQDALLNVFEKLDQFEARSEGSFRNWLARCVANSVNEHLRKQQAKKRGGGRRRVLTEFEGDDLATTIFAGKSPSPSALLRGRETAERIEAALLKMEERHREVILLRRFCEMSYAEIADAMGFTDEANVRKSFSRALERLRELAGI